MKNFDNFNDLIVAATSAFQSGDLNTYDSLVQTAGNFLAGLVRKNYLDLALNLEPLWYTKLVKLRETEENYHSAFSRHISDFWLAGKNLGKLQALSAHRDVNSCAFILHTGVLLGHTEVMLKVLRTWRVSAPLLRPTIVSLNSMSVELADSLREIGIRFVCPSGDLTPTQRFVWARSICTQERINTAIWLSTPCWVSFAFGYRLAPRQILWSLKFHPVHLGDTVIHVGMTKPSRVPVKINGFNWLPFSPPLVTGVSSLPAITILSEREKFPRKVLIGSLAREEKYNSDTFLYALISILQKAPHVHFLYTGRNDSQQIRIALERAGLTDRASFVGWVDTNLYSQVLDVFLETFPFGCGVTGAQAVENGTKVVSNWGENTLPTYYFASFEEAACFKSTWRISLNSDDYVRNSLSVIEKETGKSEIQERDNTSKLSVLDESKPEELRKLFSLPGPPTPA